MKKLMAKWLIGDIVKKYTTNMPYDVVIDNLAEAIKENSFSIVGIHDMKETYQKKNLDITSNFEYKIIQICNAQKSHKALSEMSFDMGIMMPKSIIVAKENGKTTLRFMKMKPWMVSMMFPELNIAPLSKNVSNIMEKIVLETIEKK